MQMEIIKNSHERGHFGVTKTKELINREYYIENLDEKIKKCINNCIECILASRKMGKKEGFLHPIDKGEQPLMTYHIDHIGPMSTTPKNYKYILTVVDGFTKFVWIYPTKSLKTEEVLQKLKSQQACFGSPLQIISDRGTAFTSQDFEKYCEEENIKHHKITTGQPRGNGQAERMNQIIINILGKLSIENPSNWYKYVPLVQQNINSTYQRSIGCSPMELLTGVKMRCQEDSEVLKLLDEELIQNFKEKRNELREEARKGILKIQEENRKSFNKNRKNATDYQVGDLVAIQRTQFTTQKLNPKFLGPYEVTAVTKNNRYVVTKLCGEGPVNTTTSSDMMKRWVGVEDSSGSDEE